MDLRKERLLECLRRWVAQRPGLDFCNYGDVSAYRSDMRSIAKDKNHAESLLAAVSWREITADSIIQASTHAFSGRLTINESPEGVFKISYCTGQYWPTEYRRAACAVLSSALWHYWRECETFGDDPGADYIRKTAKQELGRSIASRWFN